MTNGSQRRPNKAAAARPAAGSQSAPATARAVRGFGDRLLGAWHDIHARPLTNYYLLLIIVATLTGLGILMVFSASMTWSVLDGNSVWATASRQVIMVVLGFVVMWAALKLKPRTIRRISPWLLVVAVALLIAVLIPGIGTGQEEVGSQSWIHLGPIRFQPSEVAKVAIAVWGSHFLALTGETPGPEGERAKPNFVGFFAVSGVLLGLIAMEHDMGMALTFLMVVAIMAILAGVNLRLVAGAFCAAAVLGVVMLMQSSGFRANRITVYRDALFGHFEDTRGIAFQSYQGFLSLADGSLTGLGFGQSRAKWFYLPEAKNDFIFAVVGEELGLWGASFVILAFAGLAFYGLRCAMQSQDRFMALLAASLTTGMVAQGFYNIGYVIGLVPVTGIQLPLISAGGTSAVITLGSMGLLISCARYEPEATSAMQSYGRPAVDRLLRLSEPNPADLEFGQRAPRPVAKAPVPVPVTAQRKGGARYDSSQVRGGELPRERRQAPAYRRTTSGQNTPGPVQRGGSVEATARRGTSDNDPRRGAARSSQQSARPRRRNP